MAKFDSKQATDDAWNKAADAVKGRKARFGYRPADDAWKQLTELAAAEPAVTATAESIAKRHNPTVSAAIHTGLAYGPTAERIAKRHFARTYDITGYDLELAGMVFDADNNYWLVEVVDTTMMPPESRTITVSTTGDVLRMTDNVSNTTEVYSKKDDTVAEPVKYDAVHVDFEADEKLQKKVEQENEKYQNGSAIVSKGCRYKVRGPFGLAMFAMADEAHYYAQGVSGRFHGELVEVETDFDGFGNSSVIGHYLNGSELGV